MVQKEFVCGVKKSGAGLSYLQNILLPPVPSEIPTNMCIVRITRRQ
jgi:hypothetical protein